MRWFAGVLLLGVLFSAGCGNSKTPDEAATVAAASVPGAEQEEPQEQQTEAGIVQKTLSGIESGAKSAASGVSEIAGDVYDGVADVTSDAYEGVAEMTEEMVDFVKGAHKSAIEEGETGITNVSDWVKDDFKKGGTWQYKVLTVGADDSKNEAELNKLGAARWECYAVVPVEGGTTFHLKRPARSVIRNLPAKELLRLLPMLGSDDE